jgi:AbrB family looped-hinge helix DNA binding protein
MKHRMSADNEVGQKSRRLSASRWMTHSSKLAGKGQVTIPKDVRLGLGLKEGERVEFVTEGDQTIYSTCAGR